MDVRFRDQSYDRLEADPHFTGGLPSAVVKAYRNRINFIRQAKDERDLYAWKSLRMEKLQGGRQHQHSLRLNDQWRLVIEFEGNSPNKTIVIVNIEDYH
jgi:proteic killer suppression protein